jgi:beta-galactosidase
VFSVFFLISCEENEIHYTRTKIHFGSDWTFTKDSTSLNWEKINIPHTAQIEPLVVNNQWQGDCWYQKQFDIEKTANEKVFLYFEGMSCMRLGFGLMENWSPTTKGVTCHLQ